MIVTLGTLALAATTMSIATTCSDPLELNLDSQRAAQGNIYERELACGLEFTLPGDSTPLSLASESTLAFEFDDVACELTVTNNVARFDYANASQKCTDLLKSSALRWRARAGSTWFSIVWNAPKTSRYLVEEEGPKIPPLPSKVIFDQPHHRRHPNSPSWGMPILDQLEWKEDRTVAKGDLLAALESHAQHDTGLEILVYQRRSDGNQELAKLELQRKPKDTNVATTTTTNSGYPDFESECEAKAKAKERGAVTTPLGEARLLRRQRRKAARWKQNEWRYIVCVDATDPASPRVLVRTTKEGADPDAERHGAHLFAGHFVETLVWSRPDAKVAVVLGGSTGVRRLIAKADEAAEAAKSGSSATPRLWRTTFAGRSGEEDFIDLTIEQTYEVSENGSTKVVELRDIVLPFRVQDVFLGAFRLAATATWAPWDRTWTTRSRSATNPGHEVIIDEGAGSGLAHVEFVAGFSAFWFPVFEHERTVSVATFAGLGVLSGSSNGDLSVITSAHLAPVELVVGRNFGIGLDVSLRRTKRLRDGLDVGSPVTEGQDVTRFGITPTFGIVLNFSPEFTRTIGLARKGFGQ